jgi:hypothetical protein
VWRIRTKGKGYSSSDVRTEGIEDKPIQKRRERINWGKKRKEEIRQEDDVRTSYVV